MFTKGVLFHNFHNKPLPFYPVKPCNNYVAISDIHKSTSHKVIPGKINSFHHMLKRIINYRFPGEAGSN